MVKFGIDSLVAESGAPAANDCAVGGGGGGGGGDSGRRRGPGASITNAGSARHPGESLGGPDGREMFDKRAHAEHLVRQVEADARTIAVLRRTVARETTRREEAESLAERAQLAHATSEARVAKCAKSEKEAIATANVDRAKADVAAARARSAALGRADAESKAQEAVETAQQCEEEAQEVREQLRQASATLVELQQSHSREVSEVALAKEALSSAELAFQTELHRRQGAEQRLHETAQAVAASANHEEKISRLEEELQRQGLELENAHRQATLARESAEASQAAEDAQRAETRRANEAEATAAAETLARSEATVAALRGELETTARASQRDEDANQQGARAARLLQAKVDGMAAAARKLEQRLEQAHADADARVHSAEERCRLEVCPAPGHAHPLVLLRG